MADQVGGALDRLSRRALFTSPDDLVFPNDVGEPLDESALRRRFWKALKDAGVRKVRFHDLRHSFCSMAVKAFNLADVQAMAGHASISTTMQYVHVRPRHSDAQKLSALIDSDSVEVQRRYGAPATTLEGT